MRTNFLISGRATCHGGQGSLLNYALHSSTALIHMVHVLVAVQISAESLFCPSCTFSWGEILVLCHSEWRESIGRVAKEPHSLTWGLFLVWIMGYDCYQYHLSLVPRPHPARWGVWPGDEHLYTFHVIAEQEARQLPVLWILADLVLLVTYKGSVVIAASKYGFTVHILKWEKQAAANQLYNFTRDSKIK